MCHEDPKAIIIHKYSCKNQQLNGKCEKTKYIKGSIQLTKRGMHLILNGT